MEAKKELIIQWCNEGKLGAVDGDIYTLMELSFKAGYEKRDSEFVYNPDYLDFQKGVKTGRELGIREVVEWIRTQQLPKEYQAEEYKGLVVIANKFWQAKLKEWGV